MGDFLTSCAALNRVGGLIIRTWLIYEFTIYKRPIPIQAEAGGLIIHHGLIIRTIVIHDH